MSVLMRQQNGTYKYESRRKETTLEEKPLTIAASWFESAAGHRRAWQLRVRGARRAGRAAGALRLPGCGRRQCHACAGEERRAGAGAVEARLRAGRGDRALDPRAVFRRRPDHDRARARLRLALVQDLDDQFGPERQAAGGTRRQRVRDRHVHTRRGLVRDLHQPAVVRRPAVLDRRRRAAQRGHRAVTHSREAGRGDHVPLQLCATVAPGVVRGRRRHPASRGLPHARSARPLLRRSARSK